MTAGDLIFHHHGLAVKTPEGAFLFLAGLGYKIGEKIFDPLQNVNLALCTHPSSPSVEVIWPGIGESPVDKFIRGGPTLYHTCYAADNAGAWMARVQAEGVELLTISPPTPAVLFGGKKVSFHLVSGFGIIELLHLDGSFSSIPDIEEFK